MSVPKPSAGIAPDPLLRAIFVLRRLSLPTIVALLRSSQVNFSHANTASQLPRPVLGVSPPMRRSLEILGTTGPRSRPQPHRRRRTGKRGACCWPQARERSQRLLLRSGRVAGLVVDRSRRHDEQAQRN